MTEPNFSGKFLFWVFGAKRGQKGPKIGSLSFFSRLLHYFFLILDPNEVHEGPIKLLPSVRQSVCQSVSDTLFSELAHLFFLILDPNFQVSGPMK